MHVMGWQGKRAALASLLAALALALAACGGDDSSNDSGSSADAGRTVTTGASGVTGVDGTTGATGSAPSGGSKAPSSPKKGTTRDSSPKGSDKSSDNRVPKKDTKFDPDKPSAGVLANLYSQARQVCKVLTLQGLAHEYEVAATPAAVATAYSKTYPKSQRAAVYNGCKSGVS
jgi:hypothetical protein